MKHCRLVLDRLYLNGIAIAIKVGHALVVERENSDVDWELIVATPDAHLFEKAPHDVAMAFADGSIVEGSALLVRSNGTEHVFRGASPLEGFSFDLDLG